MRLSRSSVDRTVETGRPPEGTGSDARPPGRRLPASARTALAAAVSLALGVAITVGITAVRADDPTPSAAPATATDLPIGEPAIPDVAGAGAPGQPADDPAAAVRAFLDAELAGDFRDSFALLATADREEYRTAAGWVATHADVMPPVTGYELGEVIVDGDRASVVTPIAFEPSLDQVVGLVPERAVATWAVQAEDGGWAVSLQESTFEPRHPPADEAAGAVRAWAQAHQECAPRGEHSVVLGLPALARQLCDADEAVRVGEVEAFTEGFDTNSFLAAYGAPVLEWARVVPIDAPVELRVVVAPVGQQWVVIGVLDGTAPR